jgi:hypothetical protein
MIALLLAWQAAREVVLSDRPIEIRVPVATDAKHPAAVVTFPEEGLETLVAGWAEADLSVERKRENLFLKLLRKAEGDLHVLGASGTLYRLALRPAEGAYDGRVSVRRAPAEDRRGTPEPVELIRAMRLGRRPREGKVLAWETPLWSSAELAATARWIYETDRFRGFVIRVENRSRAAVPLDASRYVGADLVVCGVREAVLEPGASTLLYLVFEKAP